MTQPLRVASVGLGRWANVIAAAVRRSSELELVGCFSRRAQARSDFAAAHGCAPASSLEELLARPDLDALLVTVPNHVHAEVIERAARAGKHVFVEKPLAASIEDGLRIVEAVRSSGIKLMVGHSARMLAGSRRIRRLIDDGELGDLSLVEANFSNDRALELTPDRWRADPDRNPGGPLIQLAVHQFDLIRSWLGPVEAVAARIGHLHTRTRVPDLATCLLRLASGPFAYVGSSWSSSAAYWARVYGSRANAHLEVDFRYWNQGERVDAHSRLRIEPNGGDPYEVELEPADMYRDELEELARSVREDRTPEVSAEVGLANLAVVHAALRSAESGREVRIDEVLPEGVRA
ncbi:MAG TPA: Gfo/Idh/MocA family oxidoreductase [Candidatus Dormibacteraeota bacterium]|nr:Gfo/Idh/MocA family oxidoreductase [Candidatus Dormibacteraeota bacterium]